MTEELNNLVNGSGFAFQLGIEHAVRESGGKHDWRFVSREHPWALGETQGFIDLVIRKGAVIGVVECKRTRNATWVFLVPNNETGQDLGSRVVWIAGEGREVLSGWDLVQHHPSSYIASFCAIRGSGENDRPLLERLASNLLASVDALANEEVSILQKKQSRQFYGFYLPIIATTAELYVCKLEPGKVDLINGTLDLDASNFEQVPFVRFEKGFSTVPPPGPSPSSLEEAAKVHERTVWVVRARDFVSFLKTTRAGQFAEPHPWVEPLRSLSAAKQLKK